MKTLQDGLTAVRAEVLKLSEQVEADWHVLEKALEVSEGHVSL